MGFLNWWQKEQPEEEETSSQLDLLGQSKDLVPQRKRADGATVFKRFTGSIRRNGGDDLAYQNSIVAETQELFGCNPNDLYQATGGKPGRRETLPEVVQETYMVNEVLATHELNRLEGTIGGETQEEVNDQIVGTVREQSKRTRKWLPW